MPDGGETIKDGQFDWSGGVDSGVVSTIQSAIVPEGLQRNQLAWLDNGIVRGGGITQRPGWIDKGQVHDGSAIFQGAEVYEPDSGNPYLIASIGGKIYRVDPDSPTTPQNLSDQFGLNNPSSTDQAWFCQGEQFMVIQAGDGVTKPLFWDSQLLRRSNGITGVTTKDDPNINELPAARAMDYYQGRLFYAQGRKYTAGDIVKGANGTKANGFRDSILKVTENPLAIGGDGFTVPSNAGDIRAIKHAANMDNALGESDLFVFTRKSVYRLTVPVTRADWINSKEPLQKVVQKTNGSVGDRCVVAVNGDLYYQSLEPAIRSLAVAVRNFGQPGNVTISSNLIRIMNSNDRSLMHNSSGICFDNRMWQTVLPYRTPVGIAFKGIAPLDFNPLGNLAKDLPPVWEGIYEGVDFLQVHLMDFGGLERALAFVRNQADGTIHLWEMTRSSKVERVDDRITWVITTPAFTWGKEFDLKKLVAAEIWYDRMLGSVDFQMYYRPDADNCWYLWAPWQDCSAKNSDEDFFASEEVYPAIPLQENYSWSKTLPEPQPVCQSKQGRLTKLGYQFQIRLVIKGFCRIRGIILHATKLERKLYANMVKNA
jgi:hypothetical protein